MKPVTEQSHYRRIARVVEAIVANPAAAHSVDSLAAVACLSPYHFHRIYHALTGERLAETVQRLRLTQAAHQLNDAGETVTAAALDAGYDSPQAFARAFRGFTGLSPSGFRARQAGLAQRPGCGADLVPPQASLPDAVELVELAPLDLWCLRHQGPVGTIGVTYRRLSQALGSGFPPPRPPVGVCIHDPGTAAGFHYFAGMAAAGPIAPGGMVSAVPVEGGLYARYRLVGPWALIAPTFRVLFSGWLPRSGFERDDRPALEFYHPSSRRGRDCVTDLLVPVRRR
ncbi:MAG: helix-turn-helix domain-containing protein [Azospirillaceae bacterium]|nr:helix-turn-helix domain-containing protein [Azospirillaceae bacterium]